MFGYYWGNFEKHNLFSESVVTTFWATFSENWATFYSNIWSHCSWRTYVEGYVGPETPGLCQFVTKNLHPSSF